jgi:hypothetical protein
MLEHIRSPTGFKLFKDYLEKRYCEENIHYIAMVSEKGHAVFFGGGGVQR